MTRELSVLVAFPSAEIVQPHEARWLSWLSIEERSIHARMATPALAAEYLTAHALVRWALSRSANSGEVPPEAWAFERTASGKPFVRDRAGAHFNLSHTNGCVACVLADVPVGIDVEPLAKGPLFLAQAKGLFSPEEQSGLTEERAVELWTAKEAYFKASGDGIARKPSRVTTAAMGWHVITRRAARDVVVSVATRETAAVILTEVTLDALA